MNMICKNCKYYKEYGKMSLICELKGSCFPFFRNKVEPNILLKNGEVFCYSFKSNEGVEINYSPLVQKIMLACFFIEEKFPEIYKYMPELFFTIRKSKRELAHFNKFRPHININSRYTWNYFILVPVIIHEIIHYKLYKEKVIEKQIYHGKTFKKISKYYTNELLKIDKNFEIVGAGRVYNSKRWGKYGKMVIESYDKGGKNV